MRPRIADGLWELVRPGVRGVGRRWPQIVTGAAVLITALAAFALAGAALDDRAIAANPGLAQAQVLDESTFARPLVRFTIANGESVVPETGVFYPRGLEPGDTVAVEYDLTEPELVRVAGRSALDGVLPLGLGVVLTWALLGPLAYRLRRSRTATAGTTTG